MATDIVDEIMEDLIRYERARSALPKFNDLVVGDIDTSETAELLAKTLDGFAWAQTALLRTVAKRRMEKELEQHDK